MTLEREEKIKQVLSKRQPGLTVVLENVHDPHNIAAVLRSCDAVGVHEIFVVNTTAPINKLSKTSSASASKWVKVHSYTDIDECLSEVKKHYDKLYATHLSTEATTLHQLNLSERVALLFGNEHSGLSEKILHYADGNFIIPQVGMIQSLNISVACAVSLYEAYRQRLENGMYDSMRYSQTEFNDLCAEWELKDIMWRRDRAGK